MNLSGLIWDTSALLNLVATRQVEEILRAFGCSCYIVKKVRIGEVLSLRPLPEEDTHGKPIPVDLSSLMNNGLLLDVELTEAEQETFVDFARRIDDGEAMTAAVAAHRGLWMTTDDRPAIRLAQSLSPPIPVLTTPKWLKEWSEKGSVDAEGLGQALRRIYICAHYHPRRTDTLTNQPDPLYDWWFEHLPVEAL